MLRIQLSLYGVLPSVADDTRLRWAGIVISLGLSLGMLLSPTLWMSRPEGLALVESFPLVPPLPGLEILVLPAPLDAALYAMTLVFCALAAVIPRRAVFVALFAACLILALPDVMRWQPWVYLYAAAIGTLAFVPREVGREDGSRLLSWIEPLWVLRILVACVYIYSGLNKLNAAFFAERLERFLSGMPQAISDGPLATGLTYTSPFLEVAAGLGLLLGGIRLRHAAILLAASTNLFVLAALISSGGNIVVWPWNLAMILLLVILYAGRDGQPPGALGANSQEGTRSRTRAHTAALGQGWGYVYAGVVLVLFAVMPAAGIAGYWPSYLSWALYSENTSGASVAVEGSRASVTQMSYERLGVPAYPSMAVYEVLGERACASGQVGENVLVVRERPDVVDGSRERSEYSCTPDGGLVEDLEGGAERGS